VVGLIKDSTSAEAVESSFCEDSDVFTYDDELFMIDDWFPWEPETYEASELSVALCGRDCKYPTVVMGCFPPSIEVDVDAANDASESAVVLNGRDFK
jgi:hypothetical protein